MVKSKPVCTAQCGEQICMLRFFLLNFKKVIGETLILGQSETVETNGEKNLYFRTAMYFLTLSIYI